MYNVTFLDTDFGEISENFENWNDAIEFWQTYADTKTYIKGYLLDLTNREIIWKFDESKK